MPVVVVVRRVIGAMNSESISCRPRAGINLAIMNQSISRVVRSVVAGGCVVVLMGLSACGGGDDGKGSSNEDVTTTVAPRSKNAALNWNVNTPSGSIRPGGAAPAGITIRPVRP